MATTTELSEQAARETDRSKRLEQRYDKPLCDISHEEIGEFVKDEIREENLELLKRDFPDHFSERIKKRGLFRRIYAFLTGGEQRDGAVDRSGELDPKVL